MVKHEWLQLVTLFDSVIQCYPAYYVKSCVPYLPKENYLMALRLGLFNCTTSSNLQQPAISNINNKIRGSTILLKPKCFRGKI